MNTQRQPQRRRDASQADDEGVHVDALVDGLAAVEGVAGGLVHHHDAGHVADRGRGVGEAMLELLVTVEQLGEPDHEGVVTGINDGRFSWRTKVDRHKRYIARIKRRRNELSHY